MGFAFCDFGGLGIHILTLLASTGQELDALLDSYIVVEDIHKCYSHPYHTLIHSYLHRLICVLGFHHNGHGWALIRSGLKGRIPRESVL